MIPMRRSLPPLALLLGLLAPGLAVAGGFAIDEHGPVATAMAGAVAAKADDAAAVFYNPAGLAARPGGSVSLGLTLSIVELRTRSGGLTPITTATTGSPVSALPDLFVGARLHRRLAVGIGLFSQYGSSLSWSAEGQRLDGEMTTAVPFPGRFVGRTTRLGTLTLNPTLAYQPSPAVAFGLGVDVLFGTLELERTVRFGDAEGGARLAGNGRQVGMNFGVLVEPLPGLLAAALTYRSGGPLDFDLKARFTPPPELASVVKDQRAKTSLALPHHLTFGLATRPMPGLTITTDVHLTLWSDFVALRIEFPSSSLPPLVAPARWRDAWSARIGAEYLLLRRYGRFAVRGGVGYDINPVPAETLSPTAPGQDRLFFAGGLGYAIRGFGLDLAYLGAVLRDRVSTLAEYPALYGGQVHVVSVALSYEWGRSGCACPRCGGCDGRCCVR